MIFTVFGSTGFIGSHLVAALQRREIECVTPAREDTRSWRDRELGHVVYAIGLTADFRHRPLETARAHVTRLADVLDYDRYDTLTYLSSVRLYGGAERGVEETVFKVDPRSLSDLYNLSKLLGESLTLAKAGERARVVRLSNVYGPDWESQNFLITLIRDAVRIGRVTIHASPDSSKDYISVEDVVDLLIEIALSGRQTIYNVASGWPVANADLADALRRASGALVDFAEDAPLQTFPPIDISRITHDFDVRPRALLDELPRLIAEYRKLEA